MEDRYAKWIKCKETGSLQDCGNNLEETFVKPGLENAEE